MMPTLDVTLLSSSRVGADLGRMSDVDVDVGERRRFDSDEVPAKVPAYILLTVMFSVTLHVKNVKTHSKGSNLVPLIAKFGAVEYHSI